MFEIAFLVVATLAFKWLLGAVGGGGKYAERPKYSPEDEAQFARRRAQRDDIERRQQALAAKFGEPPGREAANRHLAVLAMAGWDDDEVIGGRAAADWARADPSIMREANKMRARAGNKPRR